MTGIVAPTFRVPNGESGCSTECLASGRRTFRRPSYTSLFLFLFTFLPTRLVRPTLSRCYILTCDIDEIYGVYTDGRTGGQTKVRVRLVRIHVCIPCTERFVISGAVPVDNYMALIYTHTWFFLDPSIFYFNLFRNHFLIS